MIQVKLVIEELSRYFREQEEFPNCLMINCQNDERYMSTIKGFFSSKKEITSVFLYANECYTSKILFETIVNAFNGHELSEENNYLGLANIDNVESFLTELSRMDPEKSYAIVIENAEKMRDMDANIIPIFTKLQEFTGLNISCLFVSRIVLSKFDLTLPKIQVPEDSKEDLIELLSSNYTDLQNKILRTVGENPSLVDEEKEKQLSILKSLDEEFYKRYLSTFLSVFYKLCRDTTELKFLAHKCYSAYYTPVLKGEILADDVTNLWRNITKFLRVSLKSSHMRVENLFANEANTKAISQEPSSEPQPVNRFREFAQTLELPFYAKYLLIASFLASHNDAAFDKRLFMKHHGKEKKRRKPSKVSEKTNVQFGPKNFTIDRLLAIFYAILDERVGLSCNLLSQISTLVDLNFLTCVSVEGSIIEGGARFKSTIGLDFAINIGKLVGFDVKQFLTDFH